MKTKRILASIALLVAVAMGVLFAVHRNDPVAGDSDKLQVTASFYPLYDFAKQIGGDKVQVTNITPAGAEPHDYEPSPQALAHAQKSQVFIYNGGQLEPWVNNFLRDYQQRAVKASEGVSLLSATDEHSRQQVNDPHFWLDPVLAQKIVDNIEQGFAKADPINKDYYAEHAMYYRVLLGKLDADYRTGLASCQLHTVVSSHQAFSYLANRYGFTVHSIAGISPEEEPSAGKLAELSQLVRQEGVQYIFFESLASPRLAATIAAETGAKTLVFDPIEGLTDAQQRQGQNYLSVQRDNLARLRTALACR